LLLSLDRLQVNMKSTACQTQLNSHYLQADSLCGTEPGANGTISRTTFSSHVLVLRVILFEIG